MVVIKCTAKLPPQNFEALDQALHAQAHSDGLVLLPYFCDLVAATEDSELQVVKEENGTRVAELEKELAAAMHYITEQRSCMTCKQYVKALSECDNVCSECQKEDCFCRTCHNGSKWEWGHGHEPV